MSGQNEDELICDKSCVRSSQASGVGAGPLRKLRGGKAERGASFHYAVAKTGSRLPFRCREKRAEPAEQHKEAGRAEHGDLGRAAEDAP